MRIESAGAKPLGVYYAHEDKNPGGVTSQFSTDPLATAAVAAGALGRIESKEAAPGLIRLLEDQDPEVRAFAAGVLGKIKSETAALE